MRKTFEKYDKLMISAANFLDFPIKYIRSIMLETLETLQATELLILQE